MSDPIRSFYAQRAAEEMPDAPHHQREAFVAGAMAAYAMQPKVDGTPPDFRAYPSNAIDPRYGGMTLRDHFAASAMAGLISGGLPSPPPGMTMFQAVAMASYEQADAMMAEREKRA